MQLFYHSTNSTFHKHLGDPSGKTRDYKGATRVGGRGGAVFEYGWQPDQEYLYQEYLGGAA